MFKHPEGKITILLPVVSLALISIFGIYSLDTTSAEEELRTTDISLVSQASTTLITEPKFRQGRHILIELDKDIILVKNDDTILKKIKIVSQGKPGSYYETIGGNYISDFKEENHFSTLGHVYMPYSVHLFGNYFIHGIPYFPDGVKVSSTFSGGCIRVDDDDAKFIYNFISSSTPIIITRKDSDDFLPTVKKENKKTYKDMTRIMLAITSLEALPQDTEIIVNEMIITRKDLLKRLLSNENFDISLLYKDKITDEDMLKLMNQKATSLNLSNTQFTSVTEPITTTEDDYYQFMYYVRTYKSFLLTY